MDSKLPKVSADSGVKSGNTALKLVLAAIAMFGFGFALVPLYDVFCEITGLNGKTAGPVERVEQWVDTSRTIKVQFLTTNNAGMPWEFEALQEEVEVHPGAWTQVEFWALNPTKEDMVGQAVPSASPSEAAEYVHKTECFCFNQQKLKAGEGRKMPLIFSLDPKLPSHIRTVTMSYTLFDAGAFAE
jgi:cytochrome c oxidase assembly protein subunit 11